MIILKLILRFLLKKLNNILYKLKLLKLDKNYTIIELIDSIGTKRDFKD